MQQASSANLSNPSDLDNLPLWLIGVLVTVVVPVLWKTMTGAIKGERDTAQAEVARLQKLLTQTQNEARLDREEHQKELAEANRLIREILSKPPV